jgi:hypothetical protein
MAVLVVEHQPSSKQPLLIKTENDEDDIRWLRWSEFVADMKLIANAAEGIHSIGSLRKNGLNETMAEMASLNSPHKFRKIQSLGRRRTLTGRNWNYRSLWILLQGKFQARLKKRRRTRRLQ